MNTRKLMCALLAALLCLALLCTAMAEAITEVVIDAEIPTEAVLEADGLELDGDNPEIDCAYGNCIHQNSCTVAQQIDDFLKN